MRETLCSDLPEILYRMRRLRRTEALRDLTQENHLLKTDLVVPLFIRDGERKKEAIGSLPGVYRYSLDELVREVEHLADLGARAIALFPQSLLKQRMKRVHMRFGKGAHPESSEKAQRALSRFVSHHRPRARSFYLSWTRWCTR